MTDLNVISISSISTGILCALIIACDLLRHPQPMAVMNIVWPVTALYSGPLGLWVYVGAGRHVAPGPQRSDGHLPDAPGRHQPGRPFWLSVGVSTLHCGSGCTIGDLLSESFLHFVPVALFGSALAGVWTIDYLFAFVIGILFQYYAIKPMKQLSPAKALIAALKADALSLTFWQIGMYGWMGSVRLSFFIILWDPAIPYFGS